MTKIFFNLFFTAILISLLFISCFIVLATLQTSYIWGDIYFEQILIALYDGAPGIGNNIIQKYIIFSFIPAVIITLILSSFINKKYVLLIMSVSGILFGLYKVNFVNYIINKNVYSDIYKTHYVQPENIKFNFPDKKKNLIVLYLESMEKDYADLNIYDQNLLPQLTAISDQGVSFDGYVPLPAQNYTIAALVGGFCSVPYKFKKTTNYTELRNFLPELTCYTDILKQNGYTNYLIKSTDLRFAQMGVFFKTHGFDYVYDVYDIESKFGYKLSDNKGTSWGYRDSTYYEIAKKQLTKIAASDKPFMFTMITLDTHQPDIYLDDRCLQSDNYNEDTILCADLMASNFISWLKEQSFYKDTTVVVLGDHIINSSTNMFSSQKQRQIFNLILNSSIEKNLETNHSWTVLDIAPTILNAIGVEFENAKFGLGRSLYANNPTLYETMNKSLFTELLKSSYEYENFQTSKYTFNPLYYPYLDWNKYVNNMEHIKKYASFSDVLFNYLWLDTLSFTLPEKSKSDIVFDIDFRIMFMKNKQRTIQFYVNDTKLTEITYKQNVIQPINQKIIIPASLIKDDNKLKLEFRGNDLGRSPSTVGIAVLGFRLNKILN